MYHRKGKNDKDMHALLKTNNINSSQKHKEKERATIKDEKEGLAKDPSLKILMILRGYYEQFYAKKFEIWNDKFLAKYNVPKQAHAHKKENSPIKEE